MSCVEDPLTYHTVILCSSDSHFKTFHKCWVAWGCSDCCDGGGGLGLSSHAIFTRRNGQMGSCLPFLWLHISHDPSNEGH